MRAIKSLSIFISLLVAELLLYITQGIYAKPIGIYLEIFLAAAFCLTLLGFLITSFMQARSLSRSYYLLLIAASVAFFCLILFHESYGGTVALSYLVLAAFIALIISILESKTCMIRPAGDAEREREIRLKEKSRYQSAFRMMKEANNQFHTETSTARKNLAATKIKMDRLAQDTELASRRLEEAKDQVSVLESSNRSLKAESKGAVAAKKEVRGLESANLRLKKELAEAEGEKARQESLKQKYSKTIRNIQKEKKEIEDLLVVSPDGGSVHRPNCIIVRNIRKEDRTLMRGWKEAKAGGYRGCRLCNPDRQNESVTHDSVKYRFIGSEGSDKFHKPSCTVIANNISPKDRSYFKTYKQAVKKGYTPCRLCNPAQ